ncbi:DivIVA domain-containing protein [Kocuria massiliensis]|uniref:DivIVA domain-containing protein n=1 Tax=Kocuria massiliensis TaxID=1926282 RepID=UPI0022B97776|nr:DivIVA domain-containing protein [Kocuria massiliensis]
MTLTPEQVINKTFQPTKFREGYDQEEVDLFLDEVVTELRRLHKENDGLRQKLREAGIDPESDSVSSAGGGNTASAGTAASTSTGAASTEGASSDSVAALNVDSDSASDLSTENLDSEIHPTEEQVPTAAEGGQEQTSASAQTTDQNAELGAQQGNKTESAASAAAVIAMAQRLHDEYVSQGESEKARLIEEGQTTAQSLLSEAETKRSEILASLEQSKTNLESDVDTLRTFETKYRRELKSYLENKLTDLENSPRVEPAQTK